MNGPAAPVRESALKEGDLLTLQQGLRLLPVGRATLYRLVGEGALPSIRVSSAGCRRGRILLFRRGIEDYVEKQRVGSPPPAPARIDPDALLARVRSGGR